MLIGGVYLCGCFVMKALNLFHRLVGYKNYIKNTCLPLAFVDFILF